ncbi:MAG: ATP-dependent Clp protease proteolytic subunit [Kiritimatiellae bacterium]|nr:ATP-dependent Clp protease proteolytic subunit [Kiritimatiellia bacterium]
MKTLKFDAEIGNETTTTWWGRTIGPDAVTDFLAGAAPGERVTIEINSPGGLIVPGLAMANSIKNSKAHVVAHVTGIAASMASVIMCACDEIQLEEGSFVMMHNPWSWAEGDADAMRHEAEVLDKMKAAIMAFYRGKFGGKTDEELSAIMDAETWMTGDDALRAGLKCVVIPTTVQAAACATRHHFAHMPEAAARFLAVKDEPPPASAEPKGKGAEGVEAPAKPKSPEKGESADSPKTEAPASEPSAQAASAEDWQARLAGLQAAKDKEIAALAAARDDLKHQLDESQKALAAAQTEASSYKAKIAEGEKALADLRKQLDAEIAQHRKLASAALKQPSTEGAAGSGALDKWQSAMHEITLARRTSKN